jgi:Ribbon-helix-helix domain
MSRTLTIRITDEISQWLKQVSRRTGIPAGRIVREQLERAMTESAGEERPFMRLAGSFNGPGNLSIRKGFARR